MRKLTLLSTAAAVMLIGTAAASAQGMKQEEGPAAQAPAAQQKAPAEKMAPSIKSGQRKTPETTGQASPDVKSGERGKTPQTTGQAPSKASDSEKGEMKGRMDKGAEPHAQGDNKTNGGAASKSSETTKQRSTTTGQGAAAGNAKLSTEQRTKITTVFKQHRVEPAHLNVSVSVGTRIPANVHFYPIPQEVFVIYPEWRGYDYVLVGDQIVVIDPRSHEIVAILEA